MGDPQKQRDESKNRRYGTENRERRKRQPKRIKGVVGTELRITEKRREKEEQRMEGRKGRLTTEKQ